MTGEQRTALEQIRALAAPLRLRVKADVEGWPIIPGKLGQIESIDPKTLAVYTDRPRLFAKMWAIPGVRRHQTGDTAMRALFPPESLAQVAGVIRARTRRVGLTPEEARKRSGLATVRATSGPQEATRRAEPDQGSREPLEPARAARSPAAGALLTAGSAAQDARGAVAQGSGGGTHGTGPSSGRSLSCSAGGGSGQTAAR